MFNDFRFNKQSKEVRFGSYVFGPVVMRMYYFLNKPDEALEVSCKCEYG
jgi:pentatricopeptide repeat domain-containing protein 2